MRAHTQPYRIKQFNDSLIGSRNLGNFQQLIKNVLWNGRHCNMLPEDCVKHKPTMIKQTLSKLHIELLFKDGRMVLSTS